MLIFSYLYVLIYILGAQKNHLIETVLLRTHNIYVMSTHSYLGAENIMSQFMRFLVNITHALRHSLRHSNLVDLGLKLRPEL